MTAQAGQASRVHVKLGDREYEIRVEPGCLADVGPSVGALLQPSAAAVVAGRGVALQHAQTVTESLGGAGIRTTLLTLPPGERHKTLRQVERVCDGMVAAGLDRRSVVVAVGGGMVGDMAGLAASLYMRGIRCVQVPTTLLAQVDASVGGKTGVNLRSGKNLIGAFHQPSAAYADPCSLATLPLRELRCGLAEVLKHGFIRDRAYLSGVLREMPLLLSCDPAALSRAVLGSCRIKAAVVEADETEQGVRAVLNFGHTIGHALETLDGYRRMRHGEAVAIGMVGACLVGEEVGVTAPNVTEAVRQALNAAGLPTCAPGSLTAEGIIAAMGADKKSERGSPRFVLLREVGHAEPGHRIELEPLRRALDRARND